MLREKINRNYSSISYIITIIMIITIITVIITIIVIITTIIIIIIIIIISISISKDHDIEIRDKWYEHEPETVMHNIKITTSPSCGTCQSILIEL